ncbi:hypothetical protein B9J78_04835 [bacterium Unc6]|nr:hypothetical protein [bacterium Unc6]
MGKYFKETSCIIPFYNEGRTLLDILEKLQKVKSLLQIICVDDGSVNFTYQEIKNRFPLITLVKNKNNIGKAGAIREGLNRASAEHILLLDADIEGVNVEDIENAINTFQNSNIDMLILRKSHSPFFFKITGFDILISGLRIIKRADLKNVFKYPVRGYQIEFAINRFMQKYNKKVLWTYCSGKNTLKIHKFGLVKGLEKEARMFIEIFSYIDPINLIRQYRGLKKI